MSTIASWTATPTQKNYHTATTSADAPSPPLKHSENVTLLSPHNNESIHGRVVFSWHSDSPLGENEAYELAFWRRNQNPMARGQSHGGSGAVVSYEVNLDRVPFLSPGKWQWGVFLVNATSYQRLELISDIRNFTYTGSQDATGAGDGIGD
jgi:hypothetical protein